MSKNFYKIKEYLLDLEYDIVKEDLSEELCIVEKEEDGISNVIIDCEDSIVIIEAFLFEFKTEGTLDIFKSLLQKNREIVHGAFVLDETGKKVLFRNTLEIENLDLNELEASLNSLKLLLAEYTYDLLEYAKA